MKLPLTLVLLAIAMPGCRSAEGANRALSPSESSRELAGDAEVESRLETVGARTDEAGGRSILRMGLRNRSSSALDFSWAVEWFDRSGKLVAGSARSWTRAELAAGATLNVDVPVPSPDAITWRLRAVRPG